MMGPLIQICAPIFLAWFSVEVDAYSNGLVTDSCTSMVPNHGASAQTTPSPYILTLAKSTYSPGEYITVTLTSSSGSTQFKGFLIQARSGSDSTPLGSFQVTMSNTQTLTCTTAASAVSHKSSSGKTSIQVTWVAPTSNITDIQIRATVVQTENTFWTNVSSPKLSYMAATSNTSKSTASTTTTTASSTASTTPTTGTSVSTKRTTATNVISSSTTQNFQAFLLLCVVVAITYLVQ